MAVIIGVDPHKASHTAVAIGDDERYLAVVKVRATRRQVMQLLSWAEPFEKRTWAIESACGLGYLLSQQLVAAGETVVDVPATLASRVRVLGTGRSDKNDPNDARSVAIAALRAPSLRPVEVADHAEVLRLLAKRNLDIGSQRTRIVCRLHAALADLAPGGISKELNASDASSSWPGSSRPARSSRPATTWRLNSSMTSAGSTSNSRCPTNGSATACSHQERLSRSCSVSARPSRVR